MIVVVPRTATQRAVLISGPPDSPQGGRTHMLAASKGNYSSVPAHFLPLRSGNRQEVVLFAL